MSAVAAIQAPISYGPAIELASRMWEKKILPVPPAVYEVPRISPDGKHCLSTS